MNQHSFLEDFFLTIEDTMMEQIQVIDTLTAIFEEKDIYAIGHSKRVALYCVQVANAIGISNEDLKTIYYAGLIHDIGKIMIPESILLKLKNFSLEDQTMIHRHSTDGERMLRFIPEFKKYGKIIRHHHERYDGLGYPDKLSGEDIPILSRIMAICDSFDAMTSHRMHKKCKSIAEAIQELEHCSGKQFDPNILQEAIKLFQTFKEVDHIFETPTKKHEDQHFAYFFKDHLTHAYNEAYLNYFLKQNKTFCRFTEAYFIQTHHMNTLNKTDGWEVGNVVLINLVQKLQDLFPQSYIFRIFGDDFFIFLDTSVTHNQDKIIEKLSAINHHLAFHIIYLSLSAHDFQTLEDIEKLIVCPIDKTYSKLLTHLMSFDLRTE